MMMSGEGNPLVSALPMDQLVNPIASCFNQVSYIQPEEDANRSSEFSKDLIDLGNDSALISATKRVTFGRKKSNSIDRPFQYSAA